MLLAYYISAINIEATFHGIAGGDYTPFDGIVLTDTFQIAEHGDTMDADLFPQNNSRIVRQQSSPIRVIVGNPPYSAGQHDANDNNANIAYPTLDAAIERTYAARSTAISRRTLYDSYIRAIRWATDRIGESGIVAYVSNGGWIEANTADGVRKSLAEDFSTLYVYNLRGNQRTAGEQSRKEGGKVFGSGSRATVAILIAVKNPAQAGPCRIYYRDIGDYLTREQKLEIVALSSLPTLDWTSIAPNAEGDWIGQRNTNFGKYPPIGDKSTTAVGPKFFHLHSLGLGTNRDAWVYNFSKSILEASVRRTIDFFNLQVSEYSRLARSGTRPDPKDFVTYDEKQISWSSSLVPKVGKGTPLSYDPTRRVTSLYRPFCKQVVYFDRDLNHRPGQLPRIFPTAGLPNIGFIVTGAGNTGEFSALATDALPCLDVLQKSQFFPRWTYEKVQSDEGQLDLSAGEPAELAAQRTDNITDAILGDYRASFGPDTSKDDVFYYVYGVLHSPQYRSEFADDLKRMLPRIPKVTLPSDFKSFSQAGRDLADLHVGYESVDPFPLEEIVSGAVDRELYRVRKMKFKSKTDKNAIIYNGRLTLTGIPDEAHRYMLGSRSAIEWLIDRYQVKTDPASGIVNDPNAWCDEAGDARYVLDLIKKVVRVSVETMSIVDALPELGLE